MIICQKTNKSQREDIEIRSSEGVVKHAFLYESVYYDKQSDPVKVCLSQNKVTLSVFVDLSCPSMSHIGSGSHEVCQNVRFPVL